MTYEELFSLLQHVTDVLRLERRFTDTSLEDAAGEVLLKQYTRPFPHFDTYTHAFVYYRNWMRMEVWADKPITHQSYVDYYSRGCRCSVCTEHSRSYQQGRRDKNRLLGLTGEGKPRKQREILRGQAYRDHINAQNRKAA